AERLDQRREAVQDLTDLPGDGPAVLRLLGHGPEVNRARGLGGACDFVLTRGPNQHLRQAPAADVVEAKNEDFSPQGLGQCVAALFAALYRDGRDGWPATPVFGAVTTGRTWQFLRLEGDALALDRT